MARQHAACDNAASMQPRKKLVSTAPLSALAVGCATLTAYWTSIWWRGARGYPELIPFICVGTLASLILVLLIAVVLRKQSGNWALIRTAALLTIACVLSAAAIFVGVLDNCRLSCGTRPTAEFRSAKGNRSAILLAETCTALARSILSVRFSCFDCC